jgi:hypothetical protein
VLSSCPEDFDSGLVVAFQQPEQLAGDDALEAPLGVAAALAFGGARAEVRARFCRRSARTVRTEPYEPGSTRMTRSASTVLSRSDATQAYDPGRCRIAGTRLKTARSAVRSRPCPPETSSSAAYALRLPAGRSPEVAS